MTDDSKKMKDFNMCRSPVKRVNPLDSLNSSSHALGENAQGTVTRGFPAFTTAYAEHKGGR